jgi:glutamate formiminotransferase/formiminotetrahydrofolate cyclodeaminase
MPQIIECVPNFSEGRDPAVLDAVVAAMTAVPGVTLLDREMDASHHRAVVTFVGEGEAVLEAAFRGVAEAARRIDLTRHSGEHPRMGATDVIPFIPISGASMSDCVTLARRLGERIGSELGIPVFLYEEAASRPERRNLADVRRGEFEGLRDEIGVNPDRKPDFGPDKIHATAGAVAVGARMPLVAYNVYLGTPDLAVAKKIATAVRGAAGGLMYVKALGFAIEDRGVVQVSMNLVNTPKSPIHRVFALIQHEAARYGVPITESEIVGLVPEDALLDVAEHHLQLNRFSREQVLERRLGQPPVGQGTRLSEFLDQVAADKPTPGGGSVSALAGSLAAALGSMVAGLTLGRKKYAEVADEMSGIRTRLEAARGELLRLVEEDSRAYEQMVLARKLPEGSDREAAARSKAIRESTDRAIEVPLSVARWAAQVLDDLETVAAKGNVNAISDAGVAALLAHAAFRGAGYNVRINLVDHPDREKSAGWLKELKSLGLRAENKVQIVSRLVEERLPA